MLFMGVAGIAMAFWISRLGGAFDFGLKYYSMVGPGFMMPVMLGLIYRKTPWWSGLASSISAFAVVFVMFAFDMFADHAFERNILGAVIGATLAFVISAFWYRPGSPETAHIEALDADLRTPVSNEDDEHINYGSLKEYRLIGYISFILGLVLIVAYWIPSTPEAPAYINLLAAALLMGIAWWLVKAGRRKD
jgi:hypothetical protein